MTSKFDNKEYRDSWLEVQVKQFVSAQFRALRGPVLQADFGAKIGRSQPVIARYENPGYGNLTINTLLDVAKRMDLGLEVKFVPFSKMLEDARGMTPEDFCPLSYEADVKRCTALTITRGHVPTTIEGAFKTVPNARIYLISPRRNQMGNGAPTNKIIRNYALEAK